MTRQSLPQSKQQSKSDTPLPSSLSQRAAICSPTEKTLEASGEAKNKTLQRSHFQQNFSRVAVNGTSSSVIQPKLVVGASGDKYEQEADRIARQVTTVHPQTATQNPPNIAATITPLVQQTSGDTVEASRELEARLSATEGTGQPLSTEVRADMETFFGADFSGIRVHTSRDAVQMNHDLNARAFTHGQGIYLRDNHNFDSNAGKELLAHELTHAVQQTDKQSMQPSTAANAGALRAEDGMMDDEAPDFNAPIESEADVRAEGKTGIVQRIGDVVGTTVVFPNYAQIVGDATIRAEMNTDWQATLDATTTTSRREQGFWIRWNSTTGVFSVTGRAIAPTVNNTQGATINLPPRPADAGSVYTVASFHTHTPTRHRAVGRAVGPSGADVRADTADNVAGVVYDYVEAGGGNIPARHPLRAPARLYHSGPNRRI